MCVISILTILLGAENDIKVAFKIEYSSVFSLEKFLFSLFKI